MIEANSDIAISNAVLTQMREVIMQSFSGTELETMFRQAVSVGQYPSLGEAVDAWLERQLEYRHEELLADVFKFFMTSLVQDLGCATQH